MAILNEAEREDVAKAFRKWPRIGLFVMCTFTFIPFLLSLFAEICSIAFDEVDQRRTKRSTEEKAE